MAIHPIDYRYGTPEMRSIWSEEHRFICLVRAEIALAHAEAEVGMIPAEDAKIIEQNALSASLTRAKSRRSPRSAGMPDAGFTTGQPRMIF